jgi:hypothetical protein
VLEVRPRVFAGIAIALFLAGESGAQAAPDTNACIEAFDQGQHSRGEKKLLRAQTELLVCTQESCPAVLRADCAGVLRNVQGAIPSIVLAADDGDGHDVTDVLVRSGGSVIAEKLDGRALDFDPGTYDFRFERGPPEHPTVVTIHYQLREGEKNRVVRATFPNRKKVARMASVETPPRSAAGYAVPIALGVAGLAALGFALFSKLQFNSDVNTDRRTCAPFCSQTERAGLSSTLVRANVSLGIGIGLAALAIPAWLYFTPPAPSRSATSVGWAW